MIAWNSMKTLKFKSNLVPLILNRTKTVTWRMFDEKNLQTGDICEFVNSDTGVIFAHATITGVTCKKLGEIHDADFVEGHERYKNQQDMVEHYRSYYGPSVNIDSDVKIISFKLEKESSNIDYWEMITQNPSDLYQQYFDAEERMLREKVPQDAYVLDVCCGNGRSIIPLLARTHTIVGIDNVSKAVQNARAQLAQYPTVRILKADALHIPFPDATFDVVTMSVTLVNFVENKVPALREMARVTKETGSIIVSVYSEDALEARLDMYKRDGVPIQRVVGTTVYFDESLGMNISEQFTKDEIKGMAHKAGIQMVDCVTIKGLMYICEFKKNNSQTPHHAS